MDKYRRIAGCSYARRQAEAMMVAESVRMDFAKLVSMLDRQLAITSSIDGSVRLHVLEAKAAALRGVDLSGELVGLLRAVEVNN
jgi:hypothetical protein